MIVSQHYTQSQIKIFRNADQKIDLLLKDWDRRAIKFEDYEHIWFKLSHDGVEIFEKEADLIDFDRGQYVLSLTKLQTASFQIGNYTWCIVVKNTVDNTTRLLFTNQDYNAAAPAKVVEGPLPLQSEAQTIVVNDLSLLDTNYVSSALKGAAQVNNPAGAHSFALSMTAYSGIISIQGSLDDNIPSGEEEWLAVRSDIYANQTSTVHLSILGNYTWVRILFSSTTGLNAIHYRNA